MNQKDDDKATASLLLSTDEAVAEKIRRVLMDNPAILRETIQNMHLQDEMRNRELQRQMYQQQAAQQQAYNTYASSHTNQLASQGQSSQGFWTSIIGGKK
jgi:hypothetical protein